jgi:hypothetical protein
VFLWLVYNIKVSVTTSHVMGKHRTDDFVSVCCDVKGSMDFPHNKEVSRSSAVSSYFPKIPHFTLVRGPKVFKNNVRNVYSASPNLYIFFIFKISYVEVYTTFLT